MQPTGTAEKLEKKPPSPAANDEFAAPTALPPPTANDNNPFRAPPSYTPPPTANDNTWFASATPPHTHTESTLAPTSEFMRYVLAALPSRYVVRGLFALGFNDPAKRNLVGSIGEKILNFFGKPGDILKRKFGWDHQPTEAAGFSAALGLGSVWLTGIYSTTVYKDIRNMFSETVGMEFNKPTSSVTFDDINHSQNLIIQRTLHNFWHRLGMRLLVDALFIPAAFIRHTGAGDFVLGLKGVQLFAETWKRKTTMFEDLVSFVNNKINPRNGLGQPIAIGEVFDLYQHYEQQFHPDRAFTNVIEQRSEEAAVWAASEPIFQRITALMNLTYAYKHPSIVDPQNGHAVRQANFALPTFIYLLGHDLIDIRQPERTRILIEVANTHGIPAVKEMQALVASGASNAALMQRYGVTLPEPTRTEPEPSKRNAVIPKGSSLQLDAPLSQIDPATIAHIPPDMAHTPQLA